MIANVYKTEVIKYTTALRKLFFYFNITAYYCDFVMLSMNMDYFLDKIKQWFL